MKLGKNALLGGFLLIALITLTVLSVVLGQIVAGGAEWTVVFGEDSLVEEGFEVFVAGTKQGVVKKVELLPSDEIDLERNRYVRATIAIPKKMILWEGARLNVASRGVFGGLRAELYRGTPGAERLTPDTELEGRMVGGVMEQLRGTLDDNRDDLRKIISNIERVSRRLAEGEGSAGQFLRDTKVYNNINRILDDVALFMSRVNDEEGAVAKFLNDGATADRFAEVVANIASISAKINEGKGSLGRLVDNDELMRRFEAIAGKLELLVEDAQAGTGAVGLLLKDPQVAEDLAVGIGRIRSILAKLDSKDGTLGMAISDKRVYQDLAETTSILRDLFEGVEQGKGTLGLFLKDESVYRELRGMLEGFRESGDVVRENAVLGTLVSFSNLFFNVLN